jgi:rubrerythrin
MGQDWVGDIPSVIFFIIGLGALAGAILAILKLWNAIVPNVRRKTEEDIDEIKDDIHDIRTRLTALEVDVAKIDQPAIVKRFDGIADKIDRLYEFLLDRFADNSVGGKR